MTEENINNLKRNIMAIGRLLWEKDLASALNGNLSVRIDDERMLLTAHKTCLGLLQEKDIILMKTNGELLEEGNVSTEKLMHMEVYNHFPEVQAVIHTHTTYTSAFFLSNDVLTPRVFEAKFYVGEVAAVDQTTPFVSDMNPVIENLKNNSITVLRNHGVVSIGKDLFDCFLLIQSLEETVKIDAINRLYSFELAARGTMKEAEAGDAGTDTVKYALFSKGHIDRIVELINSDDQMKVLGEKTNMTMNLAVKLQEKGTVYSFEFEKGQIKNVGQDENVEFLITAPEPVWRSVFNREIDPFVATTQKKMDLRGDFARISKWYAPCNRLFELWQQVPVE